MPFGFGMGFTRNDPFAGGPSLNLQFAGNTVLDPSITFTRALNTATYFNSAGLLTTANANVPRFDYDPVTLAPRGLLIEEARTNTLLQSRDMTQAAWVKTDVTPTRNQVGIDGVANTATLLTEGSAGTGITSQDGSAVTAGSTITASFVLKRGNTDWVRVGATGGGFTNGGEGWFNLSTGAKGTSNNRGTGTITSTTITQLADGWYRCTVTTLPDATYTVPKLFVMSATANGSATRVSGATYIVDCAQLEVGAFATSYIPTTGASATRNADVATMTGTNFSSWYNATTGSLFVEFDRPAISSVSLAYNQIITAISGATAVSEGLIFLCGSGTPAQQRFDVYTTSVSQAQISLGSGTAGTIYKSAAAFAANDFSAASNGVLGTPDTSGNMPTVDRLIIGQSGVAHIRRIAYYPRRLSNAELQAITS